MDPKQTAGIAPTPPRADLEDIWSYVPGRHPREIERAYGVTDVVKLASNENPLGPSPLAIAAIREAASDTHYYPDSEAHDLVAALAERRAVDPDQIVIGNGSVECIDLVVRAFLRPGDEAVVGFPSFPRFQIAAQVVGVTLRVVPHRDWVFDADAVLAAIGERTRVVFLDHPCNPTGTRLEARRLARFLDDVPAHVLVVLDRAYYEYEAPDERFEGDLSRIAAGRNLVVLRTFSKAYGLAGLRIGYAMTRPPHTRAMNRVREAFNTTSVGQRAALAALDDEAHVAETVRLTNTERAWLGERFSALDLPFVPSVTNFLFTDLGPTAEGVHERLLRNGVVVRPMTGPGIDTFARISIGTRQQNERLVAALEEALT